MIEIGSTAPDVTVLDETGHAVQLSAVWSQQPTLITFLRHFGCNFCREHMALLRDTYAEFMARHVQVIGITMGTPSQTASFAQNQRLPFRLFANPDRQAYRAFGLVAGSILDSMRPDVLLRLPASTVGRGYGLYTGPLAGSIKQFGGDVIVATDGKVVYAHQADPIYNYPTLAGLLQAVPATQLEVRER